MNPRATSGNWEHRILTSDEWDQIRAAITSPLDRRVLGLLYMCNGHGRAKEVLDYGNAFLRTNRALCKAKLPFRLRIVFLPEVPRRYRRWYEHGLCQIQAMK